MLDVSSQISDASVQERIRPESSQFARKGKEKSPIGVFGRLLAGLLRKNQNAQSGEAEHSALSGTVAKNDKKTKPALAAFRTQETSKKQIMEELVSSRKTEKSGKPRNTAKKPGLGELSAAEVLAAANTAKDPAADASVLKDRMRETWGIGENGRTGETELSGGTGEMKGGESPEKEAASGLKGKKPEKPEKQDSSSSPEKSWFSPVFSEKKPEKTDEARPGETKPRDRRKDRVLVEVRDERTHVSAEAPPELRVQEPLRAGEREFAVELRPSGERAFAGESPGAEKAVPGGFENLLAERLAGNLSPDIVKQAAILLRDGGEGTIRLSLKPETLGKVKIHLEMAENKISGHIVVESEEALRAFEKEIHTLEQSFRDSGFTDASLDLSGGGGGWKGEETTPFFSERFAVSSYDSASEQQVFSGGSSGGFSTINLLV
jgi:hypothetical protein